MNNKSFTIATWTQDQVKEMMQELQTEKLPSIPTDKKEIYITVFNPNYKEINFQYELLILNKSDKPKCKMITFPDPKNGYGMFHISEDSIYSVPNPETKIINNYPND